MTLRIDIHVIVTLEYQQH